MFEKGVFIAKSDKNTLFVCIGKLIILERIEKMKDLYDYIVGHFTIDDDGKKIISNILEWISYESMDKEDTVKCLQCLLDGIGIRKEEIEQFVHWD